MQAQAAAQTAQMAAADDRRRLFEREVQRLLDRLYGTALRLTRDPNDAEDIVGETVAKAWTKLPELRDPGLFEAWIQRILANCFVSHWRRRRAQAEVALDSGDDGDDDGCEEHGFSLFEQLHQPFLLWWSTPEELLETKLLREHLERALDALPDTFRIAMLLVEVQGHSYHEAAALLGVPVGTIRSRLSRARGLLQRALWQQAHDAGLVHGQPRRRKGSHD
jgi:RNA polymerase sigma-70 factor (ECF subfamily)